MAGTSGGRNLEQTPTWAVSIVCFVLILISLIIERIIHLIAKWLKKKQKRALYESLEKIKSELMLVGFISLLLTVSQGLISKICISEKVADTWHPCSKKEQHSQSIGRRLLAASFAPGMANPRRVLAAGADKCADQNKVAFVSSEGIHQLHIFIFVLALFHVLYCILTLALGRAKMRRWKRWEEETKTLEYQFSHDPERFRLAKDTSFGRRHLSSWTKIPVLIWIVCFFRQFVRSVPKVDYLTLRHGFLMAHLAPQTQMDFDFRKYIKRSLEEDFKVVVELSPPLWGFAVVFLLFNTHGWFSYLWFPFIPLIIILIVGTKLQVIIAKMGLSIQERGGDVLKGVPVVQPGDELFWFKRPRLILYLINFSLFQNAFEVAFFTWSSIQFGFDSCYHSNTEDMVIRISMGVLVQILCSYVTLPLYALVTQMGSNMKPAIFNDRVATALRKWHQTARKRVKRNRGGGSGSVAPTLSSRPASPTGPMSPVHLLRFNRTEMERVHTSPRRSIVESDFASPSPSHHKKENVASSSYQYQREMEVQGQGSSIIDITQHEIEDTGRSKEFSFDKRVTREDV